MLYITYMSGGSISTLSREREIQCQPLGIQICNNGASHSQHDGRSHKGYEGLLNSGVQEGSAFLLVTIPDNPR